MGSAGAGHQSLGPPKYPPYHEILLTSARQLIVDGHFQAAVLVAHMACEVFTGQVIVVLMERRGLQEAREWAEEYKEGFSLLNLDKPGFCLLCLQPGPVDNLPR